MIPGDIRQLSNRRLRELLLRELLLEKMNRVGLRCFPHYGDKPEKADILASYGPTTSLGVNEVYIVLPLNDDSACKDPTRIRETLATIDSGKVPSISGYLVERPGRFDDILFTSRKRAESYLEREKPPRAVFAPQPRPVPLHELEMGEDQVRVGRSVCREEKLTQVALMDLLESLEGWQTRVRKKRPVETVGNTRER